MKELLKLNEPLSIAYILKEELRFLWNCASKEEAEKYLDNWLMKANASGIPLILKLAKRLASRRVGILNYYNHSISTGKVEGIINKIKVLKRMAYGFRDFEYFKLRIYFINNAKYALL